MDGHAFLSVSGDFQMAVAVSRLFTVLFYWACVCVCVCDQLCDVNCTGSETYDMHCAGKQHCKVCQLCLLCHLILLNLIIFTAFLILSKFGIFSSLYMSFVVWK